MSSPFVGIENSNEFYGEHYLAAVLGGDLKSTLAGWRERRGEERAPPQALGALHARFFRFREALDRTTPREERVALAREMWAHLLDALGFDLRPALKDVANGVIPVLAEIQRPDGTPLVWWVPSLGARGDEAAPLARPILPDLLELAADNSLTPPSLAKGSIEDLVTAAFDLEEPPRFVLVVSELDIVLAERARWADQRLLRFDLGEILGRRDRDTLDVTACLLHKESLAPDGGAPLLDTLDDSSHKHAYGVSEDLKYALRECIELLGNEASAQIAARAREQRKAIPWEQLADPLSRECLRYMYRLLFLFYIEARPELGYAPITSDAYAKGYSLERLRAVEDVELLTPEAHDGTYLHDSVALLFRMVFEGREPSSQQSFVARVQAGEDSLFGTFRLRPLRSHLFDPAQTPLLETVRFPNHILREVIEKMSLSRSKADGGKNKRRGRVSYATLGINQLGAVYEALLSFRGFFAKEELFEVKPANGDHGPLDPAYFVSERGLADYTEAERVYEVVNRERRLKRYPKDSFIYRMAGRDRQKSASYYTPSVLTKAVVKYALNEILEDEAGEPRLSAAEVLALKVVEPAVGSAAFLNEAVDQLAEAYLHRAQKERGERLSHERYAWEKQRVKMYLADNNVFGIDLNPVAVELAAISLWLNAIYGERPREKGEDAAETSDGAVFVPWFGMQLVCGNSLVGARRQAFSAAETDPGRQGRAAPWLQAVPARVPVGEKRPKGAVWHFLLPDSGMATYGKGGEGAPIRELCAAGLKTIEERRSALCAPLDGDEREALVELSAAVDRLWDRHVSELKRIRARTTDPLSVYGRPHPEAGTRPPSTTAFKDQILAEEMASEGVKASSPYRRLKLAMDYWCALWFWPIEQAELMPGRDEWLLELSMVLDSNVLDTLAGPGSDEPQAKLFASTRPVDEARALVKELGFVDVPRLEKLYPRLALVKELGERYRFFHWELEFADVYADRGGFDLVLGNPPWVRVEWNDTDVLSDHDPRYALKGWSKAEVNANRGGTIAERTVQDDWRRAHEESLGTQAFLSSHQCYSELQGSKTNVYKAFLPQAWRAMRACDAAAGFLHPESVYDETQGGETLRAAVYRRLRRHYQFANEKKLFAEVDHHTTFGINVYGSPRAVVRFVSIANLFFPTTIEESHTHAGQGPVPGIKDDENNWETRGHRDRVIEVDEAALGLFAALFDEAGITATEARLPALHSRSLVPALRAFREGATSLRAAGVAYHPALHFNETYAVRDATIRRQTGYPPNTEEWVLQGPHFFVGNPLYKCPRRVCTQSDQYDVIDLTVISDDYLPRGNFVPACDSATYRSKTPTVPWSPAEAPIPTTDYYRVVISAMIGPMGERTFQAALVPRGVAHVDAVNSYTLSSHWECVLLAATWSSVPIDFFVKVTGSDKARPSVATQLPIVRGTPYDNALVVRTLALSCLTTWYADLWTECWRDTFRQDGWTREDPRLPADFFASLGPTWHRDGALRNDFARRQALVEIDVLVAMALGLTVDQLCDLYRAQFPILRWYERDTWYDRNGRITWTNSRGLIGVGLPAARKRRGEPGDFWEDVTDPSTHTLPMVKEFEDDTLPNGPHHRAIVYQGPFDRCDREEDYRRAWAVFTERFGTPATGGR